MYHAMEKLAMECVTLVLWWLAITIKQQMKLGPQIADVSFRYSNFGSWNCVQIMLFRISERGGFKELSSRQRRRILYSYQFSPCIFAYCGARFKLMTWANVWWSMIQKIDACSCKRTRCNRYVAASDASIPDPSVKMLIVLYRMKPDTGATVVMPDRALKFKKTKIFLNSSKFIFYF